MEIVAKCNAKNEAIKGFPCVLPCSMEICGAFFADLLSVHHLGLDETFSEDMREDMEDQFCQLTIAYSQEAELKEILDSWAERPHLTKDVLPSKIISCYCTVLREGWLLFFLEQVLLNQIFMC
jgi:hypothetical protein